MFGWFNAEAARASRSKRASASALPESAASTTLIATSRPRRGSRARYTVPIPPAPRRPTISYGPRRVPGVSGIVRTPLLGVARQPRAIRLRTQSRGRQEITHAAGGRQARDGEPASGPTKRRLLSTRDLSLAGAIRI